MSLQDTLDKVAQRLDGDVSSQAVSCAALQLLLGSLAGNADMPNLHSLLPKLVGLVSSGDASVQVHSRLSA
jgi:hypothetical protein